MVLQGVPPICKRSKVPSHETYQIASLLLHQKKFDLGRSVCTKLSTLFAEKKIRKENSVESGVFFALSDKGDRLKELEETFGCGICIEAASLWLSA